MSNDPETTRATALKPCPFCGGEASANTLRYSDHTDATWADGSRVTIAHGVNCILCGGNNAGVGLGFQTPELAAEHWNTRVAPSVPDERTRERIATADVRRLVMEAWCDGYDTAQGVTDDESIDDPARDREAMQYVYGVLPLAVRSSSGGPKDVPNELTREWCVEAVQRLDRTSTATIPAIRRDADYLRSLAARTPAPTTEEPTHGDV